MSEHLFIGGPADGQRRDVQGEPEPYFIWEYPPIKAHIPDPSESDTTSSAAVFEHSYHRHKLHEDGKVTTVYVHGDRLNDPLLGALIDRYGRPTPDALRQLIRKVADNIDLEFRGKSGIDPHMVSSFVRFLADMASEGMLV